MCTMELTAGPAFQGGCEDRGELSFCSTEQNVCTPNNRDATARQKHAAGDGLGGQAVQKPAAFF